MQLCVTYYIPKISQLVSHYSCDDWNDDIHNTKDDIGESYMMGSKSQWNHVKVDERIDKGETGRLK